MVSQRIYFRLNWREYFRVTSEQLKRVKKEELIRVYKKLYKEVIFASNKKMHEHLIAIDENTRTVISISNVDYEELLNLCQKNLEEKEDYESCAEIRDALIKLKSKKTKRKNKDVEKLLLIKRN